MVLYFWILLDMLIAKLDIFRSFDSILFGRVGDVDAPYR